MKKLIYALILPVIVGSGLVFANLKIKNEASKKPTQRPLSAAETKAALKKWEATSDGVMYKKWEASLAGKKVYDGAVKISKNVKNYTNMEAVVTSLSLPPGSRLGFGMMVRIDGEDYILAFGAEKPKKSILSFNNEFEQLHNLKVNDKIIIKSHSIMQAPKYSYPIITGDYVERDHKIMYKRESHKDDC